MLGLTLITSLILAMRAFGVFYFGSIALHGFDIWKWAAIYVFVFVLVALREEFRARGYKLFTLSAGIGFWPAAIISAIYFGYSHYWNSGENWIGLFNAGAFGLLLCFLLRRTGNLWMPIGLRNQGLGAINRTIGYLVAGYLSALAAGQRANSFSVALRVGLAIGLVVAILNSFTSFIEWGSDHVSQKSMGVFGVALILVGFSLQSFQYWATLFDWSAH